MAGRFDYFVIFGEMRTGSNFLEANLNALPGVICHGEAFNPHFIGYPNRTELLGIPQAERDQEPLRLVRAIRDRSEGMGGFRFFTGHDERVREACLDDPRCAKILLGRNPLETYVSLEIARATGQWKLTDARRRKDARARFDPEAFEAHARTQWQARDQIRHRLQVTGQTAFEIGYEDLQDLEVINGLAAFLGVEARLEALDSNLKKQNPGSIEERVINPAAIAQGIARLDRFGLEHLPDHEPARGPNVPALVAAAHAPLLFMPVKSGPEAQLRDWLARVDGMTVAQLQGPFTQKTLRQWKRAHPGHLGFTAVRHPLRRAHAAFCERILGTGEGSYGDMRRILRNRFKLPLPKDGPGPGYDAAQHRAGFLAFLHWLKDNLNGQTGLRVDAAWASQSAIVSGFAGFCLPDMVLREEHLQEGLDYLAGQAGVAPVPLAAAPEPGPVPLEEILDDEIEAAARAAYQRDYMMFGYGPLKG